MTYLSEDATILVAFLVLLAAGFWVAMKATQQGKYLIRALIALGLAGAAFLIEWVWVTDNERIEHVVYELRDSALNSDVDRLLTHMGPEVRFQNGDGSMDPEATRAMIRDTISHTQFEFIRISNLQINVGEQSRRGTAEFRVLAKGNMNTPVAQMNVGSFNSIWSLGFQETKPREWKVYRITPVQIPNGGMGIPTRPPGANTPPNFNGGFPRFPRPTSLRVE